jgi:hypothetical protein
MIYTGGCDVMLNLSAQTRTRHPHCPARRAVASKFSPFYPQTCRAMEVKVRNQQKPSSYRAPWVQQSKHETQLGTNELRCPSLVYQVKPVPVYEKSVSPHMRILRFSQTVSAL